MTKVLLGGREIGRIGRVQGGNWFAEATIDRGIWARHKPLGAYRSMSGARQAVVDWNAGREPVGRIEPTLVVGPRAGGMGS